MKPSFFSLFKRGRYFRAPVDGDDSNESKRSLEDRERFAVAALAFCLRHHKAFRRHFWEKVCRVPDDPERMPSIKADGIGIEPPEWADLSLTSDNGPVCYMWVIEAKAGAPLTRKQNPKKPEFLQRDYGYGALLAADKANKQTRLRYIVLGANEPLGLSDGEKLLGISVQERSWSRLLEGVTRKGIVNDLFDTFAELEIGEFYMEKAKAIVVTGGIQNAVNALTVLDAICEHLGVRKGKRTFQSRSWEDGTGCFGYYIKPPRKKASEKYKKLQSATRMSGWCIAWFGYEYDAAEKTNKAVWFYLDAEKARDSLKEKLSKQFSSAEPERDEAYCVRVTSPLKKTEHDFKWFQSVVDCAIKT